ncbi:hypothetical protein [uncultured Psychrobacter sp.]|uniref:hypothetical protein n=1 Tax=uncultured Psychrobacter sp. TaxID=259303 RepID=UPI0030D8FC2A
MEHCEIDADVSDKVRGEIEKRGFTIEVCHSNSELSPLRHSDFVIVGGGGHGGIASVANANIPSEHHGSKIEDAVRYYAKEHNIDQNDMLWWTIHTHRHSNLSLDTRIFKDTYVFEVGIGGFIYMSKKTVREDYGVQRISKKIESMVEENARSSLKTLAQWINGDVYHLSIKDADDEIVEGMDGVYIDDDGTFDSSVIELLEFCP